MATLLAIDTSTPLCAVALVQDETIWSKSSLTERKAAQEVLPLIDAALAESGIQLSDLEGIAITSGPGSFTGLRIGIGVAQGLAASLEIPVLPVSALALSAWAANKSHENGFWWVAEPARDDEIYFAVYKVDINSGTELIGSEQVALPQALDFSAVIQLLNNTAVDTSACWGYGGTARERLPALASGLGLDFAFESSGQNTIEHLGQLAQLKFPTEQTTAELLLPNYVKEQMDYS